MYLSLANGTPFVYLPLDYSTPFTYKLKQYSHKVCVRNILMKGPFRNLNDRFPYPFIYLKREKGTPFGRSLPVKAIIGSAPRASIWPENMLIYLSLESICFSTLTVFLELHPQKTDRFLEQIMSVDKYSSLFPHQMEATVYI